MRKLRVTTSSGVLSLILLAAFFAITAILARFLSTGVGLFEQWYLRYAIAFATALMMFHKQLHMKHFRELPLKEWLFLVLRALTAGVAGVGLYTLAAQHAKIGLVSFMQGVPLLPIFAVILMGERLTLTKIAIVLLSFGGVVIAVLENPHDIASFNVGELYSLASLVFFSLFYITRKWHSNKLNNQELTTAILGIDFLANYILSLLLYHRYFVQTNQWSIFYITVLIFAGMSSVGVIFIINYAFEKVSGVVAGSMLNLEQVFGPVFGYIFYREVLSISEIIGGIIIVTAALMMNHVNGRETPSIAVPD